MKEYIQAANAILALVAAQSSFYHTNIAGRNYKLVEFVESEYIPNGVHLILEPCIDPDEGPLPYGERIEILIGKHNYQRILDHLVGDALHKDQATYISL